MRRKRPYFTFLAKSCGDGRFAAFGPRRAARHTSCTSTLSETAHALRHGPLLDPLPTAEIITTVAGRMPPFSKCPIHPKVLVSPSLISKRTSRMHPRGHVVCSPVGGCSQGTRAGWDHTLQSAPARRALRIGRSLAVGTTVGPGTRISPSEPLCGRRCVEALGLEISQRSAPCALRSIARAHLRERGCCPALGVSRGLGTAD